MARKALSRQQVLAIRSQYEVGFGIVFLAREHGVSRNTISALVHGRTHRRVKEGSYARLPSEAAPVRDRLKAALGRATQEKEDRRAMTRPVPGLKQGAPR